MEGQSRYDVDEMVEFIQNKLLEQGIIVKAEDIEKILDLELDFLIEKGIAIPMDEE